MARWKAAVDDLPIRFRWRFGMKPSRAPHKARGVGRRQAREEAATVLADLHGFHPFHRQPADDRLSAENDWNGQREQERHERAFHPVRDYLEPSNGTRSQDSKLGCSTILARKTRRIPPPSAACSSSRWWPVSSSL